MARQTVNVADLFISKFDPLFEAAVSRAASEFWLSGGRGSTKSSFISLCIVLLLLAYPDANAVVVRRFGNTLRDSVYSQLLWAVAELGLEPWFRATTNPMELTYLPTGQRIVFRGMDDPLKLKGVKFRKGYAAVAWFEELDQMTWEAVSSALKSLRRGGDAFWTFYSYNPPKTLWSWVNRKALEMERKPGCVVSRSTYLDVVECGHADWLGAPFVEDAEWLRVTDEAQYRWEMLGEVTGTGGSVFDNVRAVRLSDAELRTFDRPRNGIDWGWFPDPWRLVRCEWQPAMRRLVVFDEASRNRTLPEDTAEIVRDRLTWADAEGAEPRYHAQTLWCDDTPDGKVQMATYRRRGLDARPAPKGGLRMLSYQWLAGLREIAVDPDRCPLTYEELMLKEYAKDKDGRWVDEIPDGDDHSIDAIRYAVMRDVQRGR